MASRFPVSSSGSSSSEELLMEEERREKLGSRVVGSFSFMDACFFRTNLDREEFGNQSIWYSQVYSTGLMDYGHHTHTGCTKNLEIQYIFQRKGKTQHALASSYTHIQKTLVCLYSGCSHHRRVKWWFSQKFHTENENLQTNVLWTCFWTVKRFEVWVLKGTKNKK